MHNFYRIVVAKKQLQVVQIPSHMVQKLYCERYLCILVMLRGKGKKKLTFHHFFNLVMCAVNCRFNVYQ